MKLTSSPKAGFSLVELIVTVGVIGVLTSVGVTFIGPLLFAGEEIREAANAHSVIQTYNSAVAAGLEPNAFSSPREVIEAVADGIDVVIAGSTHTFKVDGLNDETVDALEGILALQNGQLAMVQTGQN